MCWVISERRRSLSVHGGDRAKPGVTLHTFSAVFVSTLILSCLHFENGDVKLMMLREEC